MKRTIVLLMTVLLLAGCGGTNQPASGATEANGSDTSASAGGVAKIPSSGETTASNRGSAASGGPTVVIDTGGKKVEVEVEIADDAEEMARGLMGRTALAEDTGMLFIYPEERELSFWMKNTLIPLSIAYMDSQGRIVDIQDMKALDDEPPHYVSAEPAKYALEVNRGFYEERGVEVGDAAVLPG